MESFYDEESNNYVIHLSELPLSDEDIEKITKIRFPDFIRTVVDIDVQSDEPIDEYLDIKDFIEQYVVNPTHQEMIKNYVRNGIKEIEKQFKIYDFGLSDDMFEEFMHFVQSKKSARNI